MPSREVRARAVMTEMVPILCECANCGREELIHVREDEWRQRGEWGTFRGWGKVRYKGLWSSDYCPRCLPVKQAAEQGDPTAEAALVDLRREAGLEG